MQPKDYTMVAPVIIPAPPANAGSPGYLDIAELNGQFVLYWRSILDWPKVIHKSSGEQGRLIRALTNNIREIPQFGKVTLTFEWIIALDDGKTRYNRWTVGDWFVGE